MHIIYATSEFFSFVINCEIKLFTQNSHIKDDTIHFKGYILVAISCTDTHFLSQMFIGHAT